ncbi:hypothetical protein BDV96DRAFT_643965 [Lophiotrema nucula]|uniref:Uncharacterized protein n=1 Tax=Lophiotrema nucula TaxID=690887 RepID=A0A6A5ZDR6_9PLEO|nr:hypothetical protein BDV96DRAFT_643965 [Lophiotrema nucula]
MFSTGLFDWGYGPPTPGSDDSDGGGGGLISRYLWVYFMLTGVLTFVVLVAWVLFSWVQNRKMMRQFGIDLEQGVGLEGEGLERKDSDTTIMSGKRRMVSRGSWASREFERWKEEARGSLRWWRGGKREEGERLEKVEEGKCA